MEINNPKSYAKPLTQYYVSGVCLEFYIVPLGSIPILITDDGLFEIVAIEGCEMLGQHTRLVVDKNDYFIEVNKAPGYFITTFDKKCYCVVFLDSKNKIDINLFKVESGITHKDIERVVLDSVKKLYFDRTFDDIVRHIDYQIKKPFKKTGLVPSLVIA